MKKILFLLVATMTNIQGIMAQEKITQKAEADGKAAFQQCDFRAGMPQQLAHPPCDQRRRTDARLRGRQGLVSGRRQTRRTDASGRCHPHPG